MAATPDGQGYWLVASDGGIFSFGDARFFGSTGAIALNRPVVGMAATPDGHGYWLVASDGGIFSFGDARFFGSTGAIVLNRPVVGMASTPDGRGYWLVASDGGIFSFGDARFLGAPGAAASRPVVAIAATPDGQGYTLATADGTTLAFGDAPAGRAASPPPADPVIGMARSSASGSWLLHRPVASPFTPAIVADLNGRAGTVTAAIEDLRSGRTYTYNPGPALVLASTVKVQILGTLLAEAQSQHRDLTPAEQSLAAPMIEESNNGDASALYQHVGADPAVAGFDASIGAHATNPVPSWALTTSTATDQLTILNVFAEPNPVLTDPSRAYGLSLLSRVIAAHRFGVTAGVDPAAVQAIKTGRLPSIGVINGVAWIQGDGRDYLIAVLAQGQPSDAYGLAAIDEISQSAWNALG